MADIQEAEIRDVKVGKREGRNGQAYLLGEVEDGKVRLGLGMVLVEEARPCDLEMAASL